MDLPKLDFLTPNDLASIPIPDGIDIPPVPKKSSRPLLKNEKPLIKYEREYEKYCEWAGTPEKEREPKTQVAFEKKWGLPKSYCAAHFHNRSDFHEKRLGYFWNWMIEKLPDVVYGQYEKAIHKGDTKAAQFFGDLVAKHIDIDKPKQVIQPFMLVGVPQEKIDKLFTPKSYEDAEIIPSTSHEK